MDRLLAFIHKHKHDRIDEQLIKEIMEIIFGFNYTIPHELGPYTINILGVMLRGGVAARMILINKRLIIFYGYYQNGKTNHKYISSGIKYKPYLCSENINIHILGNYIGINDLKDLDLPHITPINEEVTLSFLLPLTNTKSARNN